MSRYGHVRRRRFSPRLFEFGARWAVGRRAVGGARCAVRGARCAVECHLGFRGAGAEFEAILVVTGSGDPEVSAFQRDDDAPRGRCWAKEK